MKQLNILTQASYLISYQSHLNKIKRNLENKYNRLNIFHRTHGPEKKENLKNIKESQCWANKKVNNGINTFLPIKLWESYKFSLQCNLIISSISIHTFPGIIFTSHAHRPSLHHSPNLPYIFRHSNQVNKFRKLTNITDIKHFSDNFDWVKFLMSLVSPDIWAAWLCKMAAALIHLL